MERKGERGGQSPQNQKPKKSAQKDVIKPKEKSTDLHVRTKEANSADMAALRRATRIAPGKSPVIAASATRAEKPHTLSRPPDSSEELENKMEKMENMLLTQTVQQTKFQRLVMDAMTMQHCDDDNFGNEDDFNSWYISQDDEASIAAADADNASVITTATGLDITDGSKPADDEGKNETDGFASTDQPKGFAIRYCQPVDSGPPLDEMTADSLKFLLHSKLDDKTVTEACEKYPCPSNAKLTVPKINPVIWESISSKARSRDLKLQRIQRPLVKGITAVTKTTVNIDDVETQDAYALLANANYELLCLRKEMLKPEINPKYAHLCKPTVVPTEFLFGDIGKAVKELDEQIKASSGVCRKFSRYAPYPQRARAYQRQDGRRMNPFLGSTRQGFSRHMNFNRYNPRTQTNSQKRDYNVKSNRQNQKPDKPK